MWPEPTEWLTSTSKLPWEQAWKEPNETTKIEPRCQVSFRVNEIHDKMIISEKFLVLRMTISYSLPKTIRDENSKYSSDSKNWIQLQDILCITSNGCQFFPGMLTGSVPEIISCSPISYRHFSYCIQWGLLYVQHVPFWENSTSCKQTLEIPKHRS